MEIEVSTFISCVMYLQKKLNNFIKQKGGYLLKICSLYLEQNFCSKDENYNSNQTGAGYK